jgi:hypothetical protein
MVMLIYGFTPLIILVERISPYIHDLFVNLPFTAIFTLKEKVSCILCTDLFYQVGWRRRDEKVECGYGMVGRKDYRNAEKREG